MNKHSVITAAAIVVIVVPFALSGLNILGAQQLEYRWSQPGEFSFFALSNDGEMEFCNTVPFWTNYQKFDILPFYADDLMGEYTVENLALDPASSEVRHGTFRSDKFTAAQHIFMTFDFEFNGGAIRLDPNQFAVLVRTSTPILGLVPYSTVTSISGFEFDQSMNRETLSCS